MLAEFATTTGNFGDVAHQLVGRVAKKAANHKAKSKSTFAMDGGHAFHVLSQDGMIYVALADEAFGKRDTSCPRVRSRGTTWIM